MKTVTYTQHGSEKRKKEEEQRNKRKKKKSNVIKEKNYSGSAEFVKKRPLLVIRTLGSRIRCQCEYLPHAYTPDCYPYNIRCTVAKAISIYRRHTDSSLLPSRVFSIYSGRLYPKALTEPFVASEL